MADHSVHMCPKLLASILRGHRHCNDDAFRLLQPQRSRRGQHGSAVEGALKVDRILIGTRNGGDTVSWKPIDAIVKKARSVVNATRLVVSRDGKALTITENGTGPNGRATHGVRVYKKR